MPVGQSGGAGCRQQASHRHTNGSSTAYLHPCLEPGSSFKLLISSPVLSQTLIPIPASWEEHRRQGEGGGEKDSGQRAPRHTPPNTSSYLSYFPQASEAFVARVFKSGFNTCNSPQILSKHHLHEHPSLSPVFLGGKGPKLGAKRLTVNHRVQATLLFICLLHLPGTNILFLSYIEKINDPPPPQRWKRRGQSSKQMGG